MAKEEILTEKIIGICQLLENVTKNEIFNRVDFTVERDLLFNLVDRVF